MTVLPSASGKDFYQSLTEVSGEKCCADIAKEAESLFGLPERVMIFDDPGAVTDEMGGVKGLGPFYIVFDLMFCEYKDYTVCYISGTNN